MEARRILLLDGDRQWRSEVSALLRQRHYVVEETGSAEEASRLLDRFQFRCAVADVSPEDGFGVEVIERLRREAPDLPVVATARENTRELEAELRRRNITYYHVKSFDREELLQAIGRAAGGGQMQEGAKILIVDDDPDYQTAVSTLLEDAGYQVVTAYDKEEGLAALKEEAPDLVILDIMMDGISDGFHFLYEMREKPEAAAPPVLSVSCISEKTGYNFSPTKDEDYFPADDFLEKPVDPKELLDHVESLLAGYRPSKTD